MVLMLQWPHPDWRIGGLPPGADRVVLAALSRVQKKIQLPLGNSLQAL